ncbi:MAG: hypothetical protein WBE28_05500, partial [bacterium]
FTLLLLIVTNFAHANPVVIESEVSSNRVSILFDRDIDTTVNVCSVVEIYPSLFGYWEWQNNRELNFVGDSSISDTAVYVLNINSELKDTDGNTVGPTGFIFTGSRSISYTVRRSPLQWEDVSSWDVEADWRSGPRIYTIKPQIHSSRRSVMGVVFCWEHLYNGALRQDHGLFKYPHFTTSASKKYRAAVDASGTLYLVDMTYGQQYRRFIFPENILYHALDVSDKGEVIIALSASKVDTMSVIYLLNRAGEILWAKEFSAHNHSNIKTDLCFMNTADKFLIYTSGKIYCFKIQRVE